jgi:hypothetical protein
MEYNKEDSKNEDFKAALDDVYNFTIHGKGNERHGNDKEIWDQDWKHIVDSVGVGFLSGQAMKKIMELRNIHSSCGKMNEIKGAISYLTFLYMYMKAEEQKLKQQKESCSVSVVSNVLPVSFMYGDFDFTSAISGLPPEPVLIKESDLLREYSHIEPMTEEELDQHGDIHF